MPAPQVARASCPEPRLKPPRVLSKPYWAGCPRHGGPGILPGVKWSHMISRLNANIRLSSGCLRLGQQIEPPRTLWAITEDGFQVVFSVAVVFRALNSEAGRPASNQGPAAASQGAGFPAAACYPLRHAEPKTRLPAAPRAGLRLTVLRLGQNAGPGAWRGGPTFLCGRRTRRHRILPGAGKAQRQKTGGQESPSQR